MSTLTDIEVAKRQGAYLPHWTAEGVAYHVVFRLADAIPAKEARELRREKAVLQSRQRDGLDLAELKELRRLRTTKIEHLLDQGYGSRLLERPATARVVRDAVQYFQGKRCHVYAWCVMPSHVHVIVEPFQPYQPSQILHSWKSFTAQQINAYSGRTGRVWHAESFDHILRNSAKFERAVHYVLANPIHAGLVAWPWVSKLEDAQGRSPRFLSG